MAKLGKPDSGADYDLNADSVTTGKGRPTPTRKEREAAHQHPLVSNDRRAASKESRAKMREQREKARVGMAAGEERYLTVRDRGPQRRYIRDYIDARFNIGEILIPVMFLVILMTVLSPVIQTIGILLLWIFFILAIADCFIVGFVINRKLAAKFGADKLQRGHRWYITMRALQLRLLRLPKPQVKRRQYPS